MSATTEADAVQAGAETAAQAEPSPVQAACRFCAAPLTVTFVDLGMSPLCESYLSAAQLNQGEVFYPLHVWVCERCFLVQLEAYVSPEHIFTEYAYFSSYADTWLEHARRYTEQVTARLGLSKRSQVVEVASNDGYLLQYFVERGIPALGIEPAANVARVAEGKGVPTRVEFFGQASARQLAAEGLQADLLIGNNVLAQVPDLNDFVAGMKLALKPQGTITLEFPHLLELMRHNQFDTIYHEHFSYFSGLAVDRILGPHGLTFFDVDILPTHGGSLRVYARHTADGARPVSTRVTELLAQERAAGLDRVEAYKQFGQQVITTKHRLLTRLIEVKQAGKRIVGYGAPGKGNTLLNYCGIRTDFLDFTVDRNPYKQGKYLPGTHIPIHHPDAIRAARPDYVLILPWNFKEEIISQMAYIGEWGGRFIIPIPDVQVLTPGQL